MGPIPPTPDASRSSASDSSMAEDYDATDDSLTHEGRAVYGVIYNLGNHWAMSWGNFLLLKLSPLQCGVFHFGVRVGCREFHWGELPGVQTSRGSHLFIHEVVLGTTYMDDGQIDCILEAMKGEYTHYAFLRFSRVVLAVALVLVPVMWLCIIGVAGLWRPPTSSSTLKAWCAQKMTDLVRTQVSQMSREATSEIASAEQLKVEASEAPDRRMEKQKQKAVELGRHWEQSFNSRWSDGGPSTAAESRGAGGTARGCVGTGRWELWKWLHGTVRPNKFNFAAPVASSDRDQRSVAWNRQLNCPAAYYAENVGKTRKADGHATSHGETLPHLPPAQMQTQRYSDLGAQPHTASLDEIRKAYRKLALKYHPAPRLATGNVLKDVRFGPEPRNSDLTFGL
ncbi:unnamed protein product, partial [Symbiodinium microadriaticum]